MGFGAVTTSLHDSRSAPRKRNGGATLYALAGTERTEHDKLNTCILLQGECELSVDEIAYWGGRTES